MNGLSFSATTEKRKGILLDPRTKLILLLTITTLMFSTSNEGIMNIVKPCLSLVPFALILSELPFQNSRKISGAICGLLYTGTVALTSLSGLLSFIVLAVTSIMTRFAPGIMTGAYLISSTSISEFIGAMERMHITGKNRDSNICHFSLFPNHQRRISGHPGCNENAGHTIRREKSFPDVGISPCSFDGVRCEDW